MLRIAGADNSDGLRTLSLLKNKENVCVSESDVSPKDGKIDAETNVSVMDKENLLPDGSFSEEVIPGDAIYTLQSEDIVEDELSGSDGDKAVVAEIDVPPDDASATDDVVGDAESQNKNLLDLNSELTAIEQIKVDNLKQIDANVKRHERSHMNVGGQYAGMAKYSYTEGPDGERYAVSGSVDIDLSEVRNNPRATIEKMQIVRRAALAPSDPSNEDRQVANKASVTEAKARRELKEKETSSETNALLLYNRMIMLYGKSNVRDFSAFSLVAQDV